MNSISVRADMNFIASGRIVLQGLGWAAVPIPGARA